MYQENVVLCGASAYEKKFYLNDNFESLPENYVCPVYRGCGRRADAGV